MKLGVIDLGTNSVLLSVAEIDKKGRVKTVLESKQTPRLGEGLEKTGKISLAACQRTIRVLQEFKTKCERLKTDKIVIVATQVLREAKNSKIVKKSIYQKTGLPLGILPKEKEAFYAYWGTVSDFKANCQNICFIDIGGGSTEIVLGTKETILFWKSLPIGSLRLTEKFLKNKNGVLSLAKFLKRKFLFLQKSFRNKKLILVGSGGTITTLLALKLGLKKYNPCKIHHAQLKLGAIRNIFEKLKAMRPEQRRKFMQVDPERYQIILAGAQILISFMESLGFELILVSDKSLRWGIIQEFKNNLKQFSS